MERTSSWSFSSACPSASWNTSRRVISIDCPRIGLRELNRPCHNGGKHGLGVERRGHCTPDLFERLEFAHGLCELARPLLDFLLDRRVGALQLVSHPVEMVRKIGNLVSWAHLDAMAKIACFQLLRTHLERPDRDDHLPCKQNARHYGQNHGHGEKKAVRCITR